VKGVILVGGEGTRLRPLTYSIPKPMIPLANRPFLEHVIAYLKSHGIDDIVLSMCYRPDVIEKHFGDGRDFGIKLAYAVETSPLGTAGGVKNVEDHLDGTFFVFNGDVLTDLDLTAMLKAHRERGAKVTLGLTPVEDPTAYGLVETESDLRVKAFVEKPTWDRVTTNLINAGTYIVEPEVMGHVPRDTFYMFERGLFPLLLKNGEPVYGFPSDAYWIDVGTPEKYLAVHRDLLGGRTARPLLDGAELEGVRLGEGCTINPSARLVPPIVLGRRVRVGDGAVLTGPLVIGDDCVVGPKTTIEDAIMWKGITIGSRAVIRHCVVGNGSAIGDDVCLTNGAVVADGCVVGAGNRLEGPVKILPNRTIEANTIMF
jgi:mannose-1-phosphate guanylyltransferase